nr:MAG TPA: hypothetical protein [Caudoviricetes sp.]
MICYCLGIVQCIAIWQSPGKTGFFIAYDTKMFIICLQMFI